MQVKMYIYMVFGKYILAKITGNYHVAFGI